MKTCRECVSEKVVSEFYAASYGDGYRPVCKECSRASSRKWHRANPDRSKAKRVEWRAANPEYWRANMLVKNYGMSMDDYDQMLENQHGGCAICGLAQRGRPRLCVDHDHKTGKVRGLLCDDCNTSLGKFKDNTALLERAIGYLERNA